MQQLGTWLLRYAFLLAELHLLPCNIVAGSQADVLGCQSQVLQLMSTADRMTTAALGNVVSGLTAYHRLVAAAQGIPAELVPPVLLPLHSLRYVGCGASKGAILQHLSPHILTELEFYVYRSPFGQREDVVESHLAAAVDHMLVPLSRLTSLQRLTLGLNATLAAEQERVIASRVISIAARLTQLRHLHLELQAVAILDLQQLPASLQELKVVGTLHRAPQQPALQLLHLSQLTSLHLESVYCCELQPFSLQAGDQLPEQLQQLTLTAVKQVEQVLQPRQLRELELSYCGHKAAEMQRLTALTRLKELKLSHQTEADGAAADTVWMPGSNSSCIWQQLPLVHLHLRCDVIGPQVVRALGLATRLTHLSIAWCKVEATAQQLAEQLGELHSLQELWILGLELQPPQHDGLAHSSLQMQPGQGDVVQPSASAGQSAGQQLQELSLQQAEAVAHPGRALLAVVAQLPALRYLALYTDEELWTAAAVLELHGATQLTRLRINSSAGDAGKIGDEVIVRLLSSLTGLQDLELRLPLLTEACPTAVQGLPHLKVLGVNVGERERVQRLKVLGWDVGEREQFEFKRPR